VLLDLFNENVHAPSEPRIDSVMPAIVVENVDIEAQGRVKLRFPWMPDVEPWARMCAPVAGRDAGIWAIPQIDDEVLVAFANGDVTQPYVLGGLWGLRSLPPAALPVDAQLKRIIKSPLGHAITMEETPPAITIEHALGHKIEMTADTIKISMAQGAASIELTAAGAIELKGSTSVDISAPTVRVSGDVSTKVTGGSSAELSTAGTCKVAGKLVEIN
jgi:uncharacterized protein involved in type VI secretion and phage assembly